MSDYRIQSRPSKSTHLITLPAVESVQTEFKDRFTDVTLDVLRQMQFFIPCFLLSDKPGIDDATINQLCTFYDLDSTVVARKLAEFRPVYHQLDALISVEDLTSDGTDSRLMQRSEMSAHDDGDDDDEENDPEAKLKRRTDQSFIKPL